MKKRNTYKKNIITKKEGKAKKEDAIVTKKYETKRKTEKYSRY